MDRYRAEFGNCFNADNASELLPDYSESRDTRALYHRAIHQVTRWIRDEAFRQALARPISETGRDVIVTAELRRSPPRSHQQPGAAQSAPKVAMRSGDWKILAGLTGPEAKPGGDIKPGEQEALKKAELAGLELYNLREDIGEKNDLAAREPERLREMAAMLQR